MQDIIRYAVDADGIATLTIDYPGKSMNVIDQAFMDSLSACIDRVAADAAVKGAILTSGKDAFVAGADLISMETTIDSMADIPVEDLFEKCASLSRLLRRMETCGKPFAAAINGVALGGGFEICLACQYRVAADTPSLVVGLPEVQVGLLPGAGGTQRLLRLIGILGAMPYLMEGKHASAAKAQEAGMIHAVVPAAELLAAARKWLLASPTSVQPWDVKGFRIPGGNALDVRVVPSFVVGNTMLQASTFHNLPAPLAIQSCLYEGSLLPMDKALRTLGTSHLPVELWHPGWRLVHEYPLTPELPAMTHVWTDPAPADAPRPQTVAIKGGVEGVAGLCRLGPADAMAVAADAKRLAAGGLRVLAVARATHGGAGYPTDPGGFDWHFLGLVAFEDPLRPGAAQAVQQCREAGIRVVMITGDHPGTALAIAGQAGIDCQPGVLTGAQAAALDDAALGEQAAGVCVYARVSPQQ